MNSGDSGQIRIDGTMPLQVIVQGGDEAEKQLGRVQAAVERVSSVFNKMSSGLDFSKYFKTAESSLEGVGNALRRVSEAGGAAEASRRDIEALLKSVNAFRASAELGGNDPGQIFREFGQELSEAVSIAERRLPRIAQAFSVDEFKAAFRGLDDAMELFGHNFDSIIQKLNQASAGEYMRMIEEIRAENAKLRSDIQQLNEELASIGAGHGSKLAVQIKDLQNQITGIRNQAVSEFSQFLQANELSPDDYHFQDLFEQIRNGSLTAREAIAQCRMEFSHLFDGSTDGLAEQLITRFEEAATKIEGLRTQIVQMRRDLANVGIGTTGGDIVGEVEAETEALSRENEAVSRVRENAESLGETADIIRRLAEHLSVAGVGESAREVAVAVTQMADSLKQLGDIDEGKLSSIASALYSIQGMNGFSANSKALAALTQMLDDLSGIEHTGTSVLSSLSSMNLANLQNLKVSKAALENLKNNLPEIGKTNIATIKQLVELPWSNLANISVDKKSIDALKSLTDSFKLDDLSVKFDEAGLSSLSQTIQDAIQKAAANVKLTIDNVELSAAAQKKIADAASAATAGTKASTGAVKGGQTDEIREEENELNNLIKLYEKYYDLRSKEAQAINKNVEANADLYNSRAQAIWEEIAAIEAEKPELAELAGAHERVTAAVRNSQTAINSADAAEVIAQAKNQEQALNSLVAKYQEYYSLRSKQITATHAGNIDNADLFRARAQALWDEISAIEEAVPELAKLAAEHQKVTAALQKYQETANKGQLTSDTKIATEEAKRQKAALDDLVNKYQQYYDLRAKQISAVHSGITDNVDMYRDDAQAILEQIHAIEEANPALARLAAEQDKVTASYRRYRDAVNTGQATSDRAMAERVEEERRALEKYQKQLESLGLGTSSIKFSGDSAAVAQYERELAVLEERFNAIASAALNEKDSAVAAFEEQRAVVESLRNELNQAVSDAGALQRATKLADKIDIWKQSNPTAYANVKTQVDQWLATLRSGAPLAAAQISQIASEFNHVASQERLAGNNGKTFFQQLKAGWSKFGGWSIVTRSFTKVISTMKQAVTAVKEVDAAMTELRKVTDLSERQYTSLYNNMVKMSGQIGSKLSDVITSVGDFSRLGFSASEALNLSEAALVYFNVGDQLENINEATESLISTMKAFGIEASNAMSIVDMFNEVGARLLPIPVVTRCLAECYIGQSSVGLCA